MAFVSKLSRYLKPWMERYEPALYAYRRFVLLRSVPVSHLRSLSKMTLLLRVAPYTLMSYPTLLTIHEIASSMEKTKTPGAWVECGTWNGGSAAIIGRICKKNPARQLWLFDSWEGLPEPTQEDVSFEGKAGQAGWAAGRQEKVEELLLQKLQLPRSRVHLVKGWVDDTIPATKSTIGPISYLLLDCDWHHSTNLALNELYDQVIPGGFVLVDDYDYWRGAKAALDDFLAARGIDVRLRRIPPVAVYFRKPVQTSASNITDMSSGLPRTPS
jgi:O-methyltransferase